MAPPIRRSNYAPGVNIGKLAASDLEPLLAIQHAFAGETAPWTAETLHQILYGRGGGDHVWVARDEGAVVGAIGCMPRGDVFSLFPLLAVTGRVASALVELGLREAGSTPWIRASTGARDSHVARVLQDLDFVLHGELLDLSRPTGDLAAPEIAPLRWCSLTELEPSRLLALHNETFREHPLALDFFAQLVLGASASASSVIADGDRYVAYLIARREVDALVPYAHIHFVGVRDAYRRRGLGRAMIARALGGAHREGLPVLRATVSSLNAGSRELHRRSGFSVLHRDFVWEYTR